MHGPKGEAIKLDPAEHGPDFLALAIFAVKGGNASIDNGLQGVTD